MGKQYAPPIPTINRGVRFRREEWDAIQRLIARTNETYSSLVRRGLAMVADAEGEERPEEWNGKR